MTARFRDEPWVAEVIEIEFQKRMAKDMQKSVDNAERIAPKEARKAQAKKNVEDFPESNKLDKQTVCK